MYNDINIIGKNVDINIYLSTNGENKVVYKENKQINTNIVIFLNTDLLIVQFDFLPLLIFLLQLALFQFLDFQFQLIHKIPQFHFLLLHFQLVLLFIYIINRAMYQIPNIKVY